MKAIIIDDEQQAIDVLVFHLNEYFKDIEIIGTYTEASEGLGFILKQHPDVLFLDINMPKINGINFLEQINQFKIPVVFVTAHAEYAIDAIKLQAFDYLLKPINLAELNRVYQKLVAHGSKQDLSVEKEKKINLKVSSNYHVLNENDVVLISSDGNYTTVHTTTNKKHVISKNLKKVEDNYFSAFPFFKVHQSFVININHVKTYNSQEVTLTNNQKCPISNKNKENFMSLMESR
ncbi:MAG: LytR/AlgR family response regulator transcription factor [Putridiphycobacter sp.]